MQGEVQVEATVDRGPGVMATSLTNTSQVAQQYQVKYAIGFSPSVSSGFVGSSGSMSEATVGTAKRASLVTLHHSSSSRVCCIGYSCTNTDLHDLGVK